VYKSLVFQPFYTGQQASWRISITSVSIPESMGTTSLLHKNLVVTALGHDTNTFLPCSRLWACIFSTRVWATGAAVPCVYAFRWVASGARSNSYSDGHRQVRRSKCHSRRTILTISLALGYGRSRAGCTWTTIPSLMMCLWRAY